MKKGLIFGLCLFLGACSRQPPVPEDLFYRLPAPQAVTRLHSPIVEKLVWVNILESDGLHRERAIVFTNDSQGIRLQQHHYHFWMEPPPRLLQRQLVRYLRAVDFSPMVLSENRVAPDGVVIAGRILRFERELVGDSTQAVVGLELRFSRGRDAPLLIREYEALVPSEKSLSNSVLAFEVALSRIFADFVGDVRKTLSAGGQASG